jgi:type IV pilus assembly protein PilW
MELNNIMNGSVNGYEMTAIMSEKGFTLVELLTAMVPSLIVLGALTSTFIIQERSYEQQAYIVEMQENVRAGMQMMIRELVMAGYDPTSAAGAGIVSANASSIRFTMDLNGDGDVSDSNEDVTYALDATDKQLTRKSTAIDTATPLAENIQGLSFTYYDSNNGITSVVGKIRRITIQLTAKTRKPDPNYSSNNGYRTRVLTSDVSPRNLCL